MISKRYFPGSSEFGGSSLTLLNRSWMTPWRQHEQIHTHRKRERESHAVSKPEVPYVKTQPFIDNHVLPLFLKGLFLFVYFELWYSFFHSSKTVSHGVFADVQHTEMGNKRGGDFLFVIFHLMSSHVHCLHHSIYNVLLLSSSVPHLPPIITTMSKVLMTLWLQELFPTILWLNQIRDAGSMCLPLISDSESNNGYSVFKSSRTLLLLPVPLPLISSQEVYQGFERKM